ncbi:MAG TPA: hypothetical protein VLA23_10115 [Candidatus Limnocylindrales bacterium]|nr:hypothetical protein [Candidatus Limnocylindrales bacterium]
MGHDQRPGTSELPIHVTRDGRVFVHVGTRFVEASLDEVDRTLERLAADGGTVVYSRDDPDDEPAGVALEVVGLADEHGLAVRAVDAVPDELMDED